ncbi:hypothetical protein E4P39_21720 [Blastococcus sp. CT_GayMR19]|uniref:hypothetical protein n=1 Tax=Blastococcus sp. CT_GayMR19 TaxID=2559608 RepID=UPI0010734511|nr:hypothetical protein [Blastococcus sp. CT_GayMR19]TFV69169.1 hypothetical protein E4P39_21720 [Blastococcus sp. CT_GayMR19]
MEGGHPRLSYRRYSEGRAAHWLLLILADRVDAWESHLASFATLRPDNPITQTGVRSTGRDPRRSPRRRDGELSYAGADGCFHTHGRRRTSCSGIHGAERRSRSS